MLKDPAKLVAEVQHDIEIVRKAHAQAKKNRGDDHYGLQLQSMTANIDKWANNGMESARLSKEPGAKGWKGWQEAGEAWLAGIHELDEMGAAEPGKLDAITAFVKDIPQETVKVTAKAAEAVKHATVAAADSAMHVGGNFFTALQGIITKMGIAAVAVLLLLVGIKLL